MNEWISNLIVDMNKSFGRNEILHKLIVEWEKFPWNVQGLLVPAVSSYSINITKYFQPFSLSHSVDEICFKISI